MINKEITMPRKMINVTIRPAVLEVPEIPKNKQVPIMNKFGVVKSICQKANYKMSSAAY